MLSHAAKRSAGMMRKKKKTERIANPFAVRVCGVLKSAEHIPFPLDAQEETYNDTVIPGKDCKLIESGDEIPSGCDIASYEDANRKGGEWVHVFSRLDSPRCGTAEMRRSGFREG